MKGIIIEAVNRLAIVDLPEAPLSDYEARTRLVCGSLCNSTDRKLLEGTFPGCTNFPAVLGHEAVGEVVEVGSKVRKFSIGDLVIRPYQFYPEDYDIRQYFGSFAETGKVVDKEAQWEDGVEQSGDLLNPHQVLPSGIEPDVGVMAITLKETLSFMKRFEVGAGTSVAVFGTGPVGATFVAWAKILGASHVVLLGRTPESIERAAALCNPDATMDITGENVPERLRELSGGAGFDRVVEGVGDSRIIDWGVDALTEEGMVGVYGVPPSTQDKASHADDPRVKYITQDEAEVHEEFFEHVAADRIDPMSYMSHRMAHNEIEQGFAVLRDRSAFKVMLDW
jgi:L-iditol 2-dehydrogenase